MSAGETGDERSAMFKIFEESLSGDQRHFLLRYPELLNPELVALLYRASLERLTVENGDLTASLSTLPTSDLGRSTTSKRRKMVNSWMTFRSYYSPLIKDLPQKFRSPMIALLWRHDINHGLWELLSATFNYLRDNHEEDCITIEKYLATATLVVPVIRANEYLTRCGWIRVRDTFERTKEWPQQFPKSTNLSCAELAYFCFERGLVSRLPDLKRADPKSMASVQGSISFTSTMTKMSSRQETALVEHQGRWRDRTRSLVAIAEGSLEDRGEKHARDMPGAKQIDQQIHLLMAPQRETDGCNEAKHDLSTELFFRDDIEWGEERI